MIARPSHWRHGGGGRESLPPSGSALPLADRVKTSDTWGKITSRPAYTQREIELIAYQIGETVAAVKRAIDLGLIP
jgi:hypothetical protein